MKIAVTGANGFLGSILVSRLSAPERQTVALLRRKADTSLLAPDQFIRYIDYNDSASIQTAIADCDVVIHNAGKTRALTFSEMLDANLGITARVVEAVNYSSVRHFIYISSQAASRPSWQGEAIDETADSAPVTWYGKSKLWAERLIVKRCSTPWTILRPVPVYGGGDKDFLSLFRMAVRGLSLSMGSSSQILNMIHANQISDFILACIQYPTARNEIFFASDGQSYTQEQITSSIAKAVGKKVRSLNVPAIMALPVFKLGDLAALISGKASVINSQKYLEFSAPHWNCDVSKARRLLGWDPEPRFDELIKETYQWYREHGWL